MTVQSNNPVVNYTGNGVTTSFNAPSNCISPPLVALNGVTLTLNSDYTLVSAGGLFTTVVMTVAPANLAVLSVKLNEPFTQLTHWVEGDPFPAASHEAAADHVVLLAQQLQGQLAQAPTLPVGTQSSAPLGPPPSGTVLGWLNGAWTWVAAPTSGLQALLASTASGQGAALVEYLAPFTGAVGRTVQSKGADVIHVKDFGAVGNFVTDDTAAIAAAIAAAPAGSIVQFGTGHLISSTIVINKPLTLRGLGKMSANWVTTVAPATDNDYTVKMTASGVNAFLLSANATNFPYYSGQLSCQGVKFEGMKILGPGWDGSTGAQLAAYGSAIATDMSQAGTTTPAGNVHYKLNTFRDLTIRYFNAGIDLTGICYQNNLIDCVLSDCNYNLRLTSGTAGYQSGGQNRASHCQFEFSRVWNIQCGDLVPPATAGPYSGDLALDGCSITTGNGGIWMGEKASLYAVGCMFEANGGAQCPGTTNPLGAAVYVNFQVANPNTDTNKIFMGCKFIGNTYSVYFQNTYGWSNSSGVQFPMSFRGCDFQDTTALNVLAAITNPVFYIGPDCSGISNGFLAPSQLVNFGGANATGTNVNALNNFSNGYPVVYQGITTAATSLASVDVPFGSTLHLDNVNRYSFAVPSGTRSTAQLLAINASGTTLISGAGNGATQNMLWVNGTGATVTVRIYTDNGYNSGTNPQYISLSYRVVSDYKASLIGSTTNGGTTLTLTSPSFPNPVMSYAQAPYVLNGQNLFGVGIPIGTTLTYASGGSGPGTVGAVYNLSQACTAAVTAGQFYSI